MWDTIEQAPTIKFKKIGENKLPKQAHAGEWYDCSSAVTISLKAGEFAVIPLGFACKLPSGYEAHLVPRSSTFKNYGILQTNGVGIIDEDYCGNDDQWGMPVYATRDTVIHLGDRICQFRVMLKQITLRAVTVQNLGSVNRGGFGSTGK